MVTFFYRLCNNLIRAETIFSLIDGDDGEVMREKKEIVI